jgi:hypothetical protein
MKTSFGFQIGGLGALLVLSGCGQSTDGVRGSWDKGFRQSGNSQVQQSLMSSTGLGCEVTADKSEVESGETFTVTIQVYNASGQAQLASGTATADANGTIRLSTSYNNTYGEDVYWNPSVTISDAKSRASCSFTVLVTGGNFRRI